MNPSGLQMTWFVLIAVLWTGYLVLEGFDFGVGMLLNILPRGSREQRDADRRLLINTVGPVWDGNEVWLLTAGGATFAAFPYWYGTMFSGFYLPLLLILVALILRGVSFEYRGKINSPRWRSLFDVGLAIGSWVPALLWGVAFGNLIRGVLLAPNQFGNLDYVGGFFALLNPFALLGGVTTIALFLFHGATFVALKTDGEMRDRAHSAAAWLAVGALVLTLAWAIWAQVAFSTTWTWVAVVVLAAALVGALVANRLGREGLAFACTSVAMPALVVLWFGSMYPYVMPGLGAGPGLAIAAASSTAYTLRVMTVVAVILVPVVLAYTAFSYWTFRRRLSASDIPPPAGLTWARVKGAAFGG